MVKLLLERFPKAKRSKSKLTLLLSLFFVVSVLKKPKCLKTETGFVIVAVNLLFRVSFSLYNNILIIIFWQKNALEGRGLGAGGGGGWGV